MSRNLRSTGGGGFGGTSYGWIVLLACSFTRLILDGFWQSFGVFYLAWQTQFNANASALAWILVSLIPLVLLTGVLVCFFLLLCTL